MFNESFTTFAVAGDVSNHNSARDRMAGPWGILEVHLSVRLGQMEIPKVHRGKKAWFLR